MSARFAILTAAACAVASPFFAVTSAAAADRYEIDAGHTHVQFSVNRFGFTDVIAGFLDVSGVITIDEDAPENSSVEAEIKVASVESGNEERDKSIRTEFWLNAAEHPTITFQSTEVTLGENDTAAVTGNITILGVTQPITLSVALNKLGTDPASRRQAVGFSATANLKRSEFGLMTAQKLIGDDIAIRIETLAHKVE